MKRFFAIFFFIAANALAQTTAVTRNPNTNEVTSDLVMGANRLLEFHPSSLLSLHGMMRTGGFGDNGKIQINNDGILFSNVDGMLTVRGRDNHALIARTESPSDGIALVGWSSSGAAAVKARQDTAFTSPTLAVWRNLSLGTVDFSSTPALLVAASEGSPTTEKAFEIQVNGASKFRISWDGYATSADKPLMRFLGRWASQPPGAYGIHFSAGDLYFNTSDNRFYCHDGSAWKPM